MSCGGGWIRGVWVPSTSRAAWDHGVTWYTTVVTPAVDLPITVAYLRDQHLRVTNGSVEDERIERALNAATSQAEHDTKRAIPPQTLAMVLDAFPSSGKVQLEFPPLIDVQSVTYIDGDGDTQTLDADLYRVVRQIGPKARRSLVELVSGESWPSTGTRSDAVTITYRAGYVEDPDASPVVVQVPEDLCEAIAMRAAEFYKQRSDSVIGVGVSVAPAVLTSRHIFADYKIY